MDSRTQRELWPGWETVRLLGRGSFGAVYEIRREVFGETERAALKLITLPQNDSEIKEMRSEGHEEGSITETFRGYLKSIVGEYSLMRKLSGSTNVVNCEDLRTEQHPDGIGWDIYIKMELLRPLTEVLPQQVEERQVIDIGRDLCRALSLCAQYNIVHRDIKPQNIFVSPLGDYKLGDFGVARTMEKTTSGTRTGTFKYMAPEVYHEEPYGSNVDLYSLGLVLYWLLNERRMPFLPLPPEKLTAELEEQSRRRRLRGEELPPPRHGSERLKRIVLKACAYDPKDRYQSAEEMLRELESLGAAPKEPEKKPAREGGMPAAGQTKEEKYTDAEKRPPEKAGAAKTAASAGKTGGGKKKALLVAAVLALAALAGLALLLLPGSRGPGGAAFTALAALDEDAAALLGEGNSCVGYYRIGQQEGEELRIPVPGELEGQTVTAWTLTADGAQSRQETPVSEGQVTMALSGGSRVLLLCPTDALSEEGWGAWADALPAGRELDEQAQALWESRFRLRETCFSEDPNLAGWDLEGKAEADYGPWSPWQLSEIAATEDLEVETGTVYRSRTVETTTSRTLLEDGWELQDTQYEYGGWGDWSDWSEYGVLPSETREVESKVQCKWVLEEDFTLPDSDEERWYPVATGEWVDEAEYDIPVQPEEHQRVTTQRRVLFRNRMRPAAAIYTYARWGEWSAWSEEAPRASESLQVESAAAWRSREIRGQYGYGDWSEWSTEPIEEAEDLQIQEGTVYRFRDRESTTSQTPLGEGWELQDTQAEYGEWGGWSGWSENGRQQSDSCNVQVGTQYRWVYALDYQDAGMYYYEVKERGPWEYDEASARASAPKIDGFHSVSIETRSVYRWQERAVSYTYTYARWGDWSDWSEEAAEASETREVEQATG